MKYNTCQVFCVVLLAVACLPGFAENDHSLKLPSGSDDPGAASGKAACPEASSFSSINAYLPGPEIGPDTALLKRSEEACTPQLASDVDKQLATKLYVSIRDKCKFSDSSALAKSMYLRYKHALNVEADSFGIQCKEPWVDRILSFAKYSASGKDLLALRNRIIDLAGYSAVIDLDKRMPRVHIALRVSNENISDSTQADTPVPEASPPKPAVELLDEEHPIIDDR